MPSRPTPRNRAGQVPTRAPAETRQRLGEKANRKQGSANGKRIAEKQRENT